MLGSLLSVPILASALCLTDGAANKVAENFKHLLSNYSDAFSNESMAVDLTDQTDSVAWLIDNGTNCPIPLGATTLSSRADFQMAQGGQPNMPFDILNVYHDCNNVFVRWKFAVTPQPVQGISILLTSLNPNLTAFIDQPYLIQNIYTEFNVGAFITNLGYYHPDVSCGGPPSAPAGSTKRALGSIGMLANTFKA